MKLTKREKQIKKYINSYFELIASNLYSDMPRVRKEFIKVTKKDINTIFKIQ